MLRDLTYLLRRETLIHASLIGAIVVGFFLAYIKDRYPSPVGYFLFDIVLALALFFWVTTRVRQGKALLPTTPLTKVMLVFYVGCFVYVLVPDVPMLVGLSALRGWCFFSLAYLLSYDVIKSGRQVRTYLLLVVVLAVITSVYGLYQYTAGAENVIREDDLLAERHQFATYMTPSGEVEFRIFSTFVSAAAFGSMMAYASCIALTLAIGKTTTRTLRFFLLLGIVPMIASLVLTGTRAALVMVIIGLAVLWLYKRAVRAYVVAVGLIYMGIQVGIGLTEGRAADRFASLMDPNLLLGRLSNPFIAGFRSMLESPLGQGLGITGHGVPFFLGSWYPTFHPVFADGDFGRIMVEMGGLGLLLLTVLLGTAVAGAVKALRRLRNTPHEDTALAIVSGAVMIGIGTLVGSPFLSIPQGMLWWFFLGALFKLYALERRRRIVWQQVWKPADSQRGENAPQGVVTAPASAPPGQKP
jgi:hypothetical protein